MPGEKAGARATWQTDLVDSGAALKFVRTTPGIAQDLAVKSPG